MAPRSTAIHLSYDLRPAKQSERRIILDLLSIAGDIGFDISDYRYVGMGANRFYDFLMIHKYVGIRKMISLEHDPKMYKRARFNVPYDFIDVKEKTAQEFLAEDPYSDPTVAWLDYDGGVGAHITRDIAALAGKSKIGDFCFVTTYGGPPKALNDLNTEGRLAWLQEKLSAFAGKVVRAETDDDTFPSAVHKILFAAFKNAYAARSDGVFFPFFQIEYSDSVPMVTVGGGFMAPGAVTDFRRHMKSRLPFLRPEAEDFYSIRSLHLTERERVLFDRAVTKKSKRSSEWNQLKTLGFRDVEFDAYSDLIRYLPRYVETLI